MMQSIVFLLKIQEETLRFTAPSSILENIIYKDVRWHVLTILQDFCFMEKMI